VLKLSIEKRQPGQKNRQRLVPLIDLYCHILPGMDDGPADIGESLDMARQAVLDGIHTVVATPHSRNGMYVNVRGDICRRVQ
jgi:protein-tyrosine phosphatase